MWELFLILVMFFSYFFIWGPFFFWYVLTTFLPKSDFCWLCILMLSGTRVDNAASVSAAAATFLQSRNLGFYHASSDWLFFSSSQSGRIFVTSTCDLVVAESPASKPTAILEQDVSTAENTNTDSTSLHQSPGTRAARFMSPDQSDLTPEPPPSPLLPHTPLNLFLTWLLLDQNHAGVVLFDVSLYLRCRGDLRSSISHWATWRLRFCYNRTKVILTENKPFLFKTFQSTFFFYLSIITREIEIRVRYISSFGGPLAVSCGTAWYWFVFKLNDLFSAITPERKD